MACFNDALLHTQLQIHASIRLGTVRLCRRLERFFASQPPSAPECAVDDDGLPEAAVYGRSPLDATTAQSSLREPFAWQPNLEGAVLDLPTDWQSLGDETLSAIWGAEFVALRRFHAAASERGGQEAAPVVPGVFGRCGPAHCAVAAAAAAAAPVAEGAPPAGDTAMQLAAGIRVGVSLSEASPAQGALPQRQSRAAAASGAAMAAAAPRPAGGARAVGSFSTAAAAERDSRAPAAQLDRRSAAAELALPRRASRAASAIAAAGTAAAAAADEGLAAVGAAPARRPQGRKKRSVSQLQEKTSRQTRLPDAAVASGAAATGSAVAVPAPAVAGAIAPPHPESTLALASEPNSAVTVQVQRSSAAEAAPAASNAAPAAAHAPEQAGAAAADAASSVMPAVAHAPAQSRAAAAEAAAAAASGAPQPKCTKSKGASIGRREVATLLEDAVFLEARKRPRVAGAGTTAPVAAAAMPAVAVPAAAAKADTGKRSIAGCAKSASATPANGALAKPPSAAPTAPRSRKPKGEAPLTAKPQPVTSRHAKPPGRPGGRQGTAELASSMAAKLSAAAASRKRRREGDSPAPPPPALRRKAAAPRCGAETGVGNAAKSLAGISAKGPAGGAINSPAAALPAGRGRRAAAAAASLAAAPRGARGEAPSSNAKAAAGAKPRGEKAAQLAATEPQAPGPAAQPPAEPEASPEEAAEAPAARVSVPPTGSAATAVETAPALPKAPHAGAPPASATASAVPEPPLAAAVQPAGAAAEARTAAVPEQDALQAPAAATACAGRSKLQWGASGDDAAPASQQLVAAQAPQAPATAARGAPLAWRQPPAGQAWSLDAGRPCLPPAAPNGAQLYGCHQHAAAWAIGVPAFQACQPACTPPAGAIGFPPVASQAGDQPPMAGSYSHATYYPHGWYALLQPHPQPQALPRQPGGGCAAPYPGQPPHPWRYNSPQQNWGTWPYGMSGYGTARTGYGTANLGCDVGYSAHVAGRTGYGYVEPSPGGPANFSAFQ